MKPPAAVSTGKDKLALPDSVHVHPTALVESEQVGERTKIWAFVHISRGAYVGSDCNICDYAKIDSGGRVGDRVTVKEYAGVGTGVEVEDDVFLGPGVILPNDQAPRSRRMEGVETVHQRYADAENWLLRTRICRGASLGTGAIISPGVTVGKYALVGAGSLVTKDVLPFRMVVGLPARAVGWVCVCGLRLNESDPGVWVCGECERVYRKEEDGGLSLSDAG